jgi:lipoprotein-releasing system ATP-binding protein
MSGPETSRFMVAESTSWTAARLKVSELRKDYPGPGGALPILAGVSFELERGQAVAVMGPSGSGKSTLLYILGTLEPPTSGTVTLDGRDPFALPETELAAFRNRQVGFVFQDHCLLPQCSVLENVLTPTLVAGDARQRLDRARWLLEQVGLASRANHRPAQLSGGERQRVAIARALILEPTLLLCDEPTGNLDRHTADSVAALLLDLHRQQGTILVVVTHSAELAARLPQRWQLAEGRLQTA